MSIHMDRKGMAGFSNVKTITLNTLKLVDQVHGLAVSMGGNRISEVGAGAGERVGWMVNGTSLASGSNPGPGAYGGQDLSRQ